MRIPVFTLLGFLLIVVQTSFLPALQSWFGMPELLFVLIVFISIHMTPVEGVVICLLLGTAMEVVSGNFLGVYVFSYGLVFFLVRSASAWIAMEHTSSLPGVAAVAYLVSRGVVYMLSSMFATEPLALWNWGNVLLRVLIVAMLVLPGDRVLRIVLQKCDTKRPKNSFFRRRSFKKQNRYRPRPRGEKGLKGQDA